MLRTLMAIAVAGAFALPLTSVASDNVVAGQASPGTPRSATSGMGRDTGAAHRTNPTGSGATSHRGRFEALDKNHDGYISRDEAKDASELDTRFSELDANNDGKLSRDEYDAVNASARGATGTGAMSGQSGGTSSTTK